MQRHTILFLAANPSGTDRLALDREARAIQDELERSDARDRFDFETRWAAEPMDLLRALRKLRPTVVHYSGHGGQNGLFFQAGDGRATTVSAAALANTFGAAGASVRVVVFNACYSEEHAGALIDHVDCVVGMGGSIRDEAARSFAIGFYGGLGAHESVAVAFEQGKAAISLEDGSGSPARDVAQDPRPGPHDSDRPQLTLRPGVDAARLILADAAPPFGVPDGAARSSASRARRTLAVTALVGLLASGSYVARRLASGGDGPTPAGSAATTPRVADLVPSAPPGMVGLAAVEIAIGSSDDEIARAFAWCQTLTVPASCRQAIYARERPVHRVLMSPLVIDTHERATGELAAWLASLPDVRGDAGWLVQHGVRLAQYGDDRDLQMRGTAVLARPGTERLPAVDVTYDGARRFCQHQGLDLPTEAQWERAARGSAQRRFPWGDAEPACGRASYGRGPAGPCPPQGRDPVDVDHGDRTPEGIANLGGNVAEWVVDRYVEGGYVACAAPCSDPVVPMTDDPHEPHVIRGGAFASLAEQLRTAGRARAPRDAALGDTGFRCAVPAGKPQP